MNFSIPAAFAYADEIWIALLCSLAFAGGYIVGGIVQR